MTDINGKEFKPGQWVLLNLYSPFPGPWQNESYRCYKLIEAESWQEQHTLVVKLQVGYWRTNERLQWC